MKKHSQSQRAHNSQKKEKQERERSQNFILYYIVWHYFILYGLFGVNLKFFRWYDLNEMGFPDDFFF